MPTIELTDAELQALYAVFTNRARVDWAHYDRAKRKVIEAGRRQAEAQGREREMETA